MERKGFRGFNEQVRSARRPRQVGGSRRLRFGPLLLGVALLGIGYGAGKLDRNPNRPVSALLGEDQSAEPKLYFHRCAEARAAGVAPMRRGEPGYREGLDADHDGIACEPYP
jgi:excalibur calcium-binding domain-containing protein